MFFNFYLERRLLKERADWERQLRGSSTDGASKSRSEKHYIDNCRNRAGTQNVRCYSYISESRYLILANTITPVQMVTGTLHSLPFPSISNNQPNKWNVNQLYHSTWRKCIRAFKFLTSIIIWSDCMAYLREVFCAQEESWREMFHEASWGRKLYACSPW